MLAILGAIVAIIAIAVIGGSFALDSYVKHHKNEIVAQLEAKLGRQVDIGRLSASLFTGVTAESVTIHGSSLPGDQAPLLSAAKLHVRPALFGTLASFGRHIQVADLEIDAPTINVVRLRDGTLNIDHLGAPKSATTKSEPMDAKTRRLIENANLHRARINDGKVRFVDSSGVAEVDHLDLLVTDIGIKGRPRVQLTAAVLAPQRNLDLRAQLGEAGDLEHLPPPIESAKIKLAETDLGPILPFLSRMGLTAGTASADLEANWTDNAKLKGSAKLARARIEGGEPFDATLDVDASGDPKKGNAEVRRLEISAGDMAVSARGKLTSLTKDPRFENFTVESKGLDFDRLRKIDPKLDEQLGATAHGPIVLQASGSARQLTALLDLTAASLSGKIDKPQGTPWRIDVNARAEGNLLKIQSQIRLAQQGLHADATLQTGEKNPRIDAHASADRLPIAALVPMIPSLANMPPIIITADAKLSGRAGMPESFAVDVDKLQVSSRLTNLSATAKAKNLTRPEIEVNVKSAYLDTADLTPPPSSKKSASANQPSPALAHLNGHVAVSVTRGSVSGVAFDGLAADLAIKDGTVHATKLDVGAWGGRFAGDGSEFDVARGPFHLVGNAQKVDTEQLMARLGAAKKVMSGRLSGQLDVRGRTADLEKSLAGTLEGSVDDAQLLAFNFDELLAGQLVRALPFRIPTKGGNSTTNLGNMRGKLHFADGAIVLDKPLTANTPEGPIELTGRAAFDGRIDLTGTLQLKPEAASALFAGRLRPSEPLPLSLRIGGTIHAPTLGIANLTDIGKVLVKSAVGGLIPGRQQAKIPSQKQVEDKAVDTLKGFLHR